MLWAIVKPGSWQKLLNSFLLSRHVKHHPSFSWKLYNLPPLELDLVKKLFKRRMISAPGHRGLPQLLGQHDGGGWVGGRLPWGFKIFIAVFSTLAAATVYLLVTGIDSSLLASLGLMYKCPSTMDHEFWNFQFYVIGQGRGLELAEAWVVWVVAND